MPYFRSWRVFYFKEGKGLSQLDFWKPVLASRQTHESPASFLCTLLLWFLIGCSGAPARGPASEAGSTSLQRTPIAFELKDSEQETWRSVEHRGKPLVVTVFTSWCQPCLSVLQQLDATREHALFVDAFNVVAISVDKELKPIVQAFLEELDVRYPVLIADQEMLHGHGPFGRYLAVPVTYLLDAEGSLIESFEGNAPVEYIARRVMRLNQEAQ